LEFGQFSGRELPRNPGETPAMNQLEQHSMENVGCLAVLHASSIILGAVEDVYAISTSASHCKLGDGLAA
jgi:hypothetical protein